MADVEHVIEPAASGRSKCRGCARAIARGELRFGERIDNPFGDGKATLWFHLTCASYKRPEPLLETLCAQSATIEGHAELAGNARDGIEHRRLERVNGVERASTGRAACRCCREPIAKGAWRIRLVYFQDGRFDPGGFIHVDCAQEHLGTRDIVARLVCFTEGLSTEDQGEFEALLGGAL